MTEDLHVEPIESVEVAALLCTCGVCGHGILLDYEALNHEEGKVDAAHDFDHCPECGNVFDARAARFSAHVLSK